MLTRRGILAAAPLAPVAARAAVEPARPHTFDELLRPAVITDAAISPDGERLALLRQQISEEKTQSFVQIASTRDIEGRQISIPLGEYQVDQVEWGKNDRLLIWITLWKDSKGRAYGINFGHFTLPLPLRRVISTSTSGSDPVLLFGEERSVIRKSFDAATVVDLMSDDPRLVLMQAWEARRSAYNLYQVDVYTGQATLVEKGGRATDAWITQRGVPMLRMDSNMRGTVMSIFARAPGEHDWKLVRRVRRNEWKKLPDFDVLGPAEEPGVFLVCLRKDDEDTRAIRTFDLRTLEFGERVGPPAARDVDVAVIDESLKLVATGSIADRLEYHFPDASLAAGWRAANAALKDRCNVRLFDLSLDLKRLLLHSTGPQEPGVFHLFDRDARRLHIVAVTKPWLDPERLAAMEVVSVRTRDGASIQAFLSIPRGAPEGPLPLVVMPHGGPETRDVYDFDVFVQALAAQGWLVLQPNFRGSGGYGRAFAEAGHGRWGDRMQEDVEDSVAHVVATGRADPRRIAICGGSYGGYAAMMGPILRPRLYRCAVSIAGVSDLLEMLKDEREDGADSPSYLYWRKSIGDPKADRTKLEAASPRLRAAEFPVPLLLLHGAEDGVVPARQSLLMAEALAAAGKPHEHLELKGEGHSGWSTENHKLILERTTAFIGRHMGAPAVS